MQQVPASLSGFRGLRAELLVRRLRVAGFTLVGDPVAPDGSTEPALDLHEGVEKLIEVAQQPYATIQIMPFTAGVHRGWDGNFTVMGFGGADDAVFYAQNNPSGDVLLWEEQAVAERFWQLLQTLTNQALSPAESIEFIARLV